MCTETNTKYPIRVFLADTHSGMRYVTVYGVLRTTTRSIQTSTITRFTRLRSLELWFLLSGNDADDGGGGGASVGCNEPRPYSVYASDTSTPIRRVSSHHPT